MFRKIDDYIFDIFPAVQKLSNLVESFTLITHSTLARLVIIVGMAWNGAIQYQKVVQGDFTAWTKIGVFGFVVVLFLIQAQLLDTLMSKKEGTRNPLRSGELYLYTRVSLVFTTCMATWSIMYTERSLWELVGMWSTPLAFYLLACDKIPPGQRFWDKFHKKVAA